MPAMASPLQSFGSLRQGERYRVVSIDGENPCLKRFEELGLTEGTEFRVVKVAPFGDPLEIDLRGYHLCLRRKDAVGVSVEHIP